MNRLKATMLCSFSIARGRIIGLAVLQVFTAVLFGFASPFVEEYDIIIGGDCAAVIFLFVFGIIFFGRHTAFCVSNSVSAKYRLYSYAAVTGSVSFLGAVLNCIAHAFLNVKHSFSLAEIYRYIVVGGVIHVNSAAADLFENLFFYILVIAVGGFIGSLRVAKGDRFTLLMLTAAAAVMFGFACLGRVTAINPAAWICMIPAVLLRSRFGAVVLYIINTAAVMFWAYKLSYGGQSITRRGKRENA